MFYSAYLENVIHSASYFSTKRQTTPIYFGYFSLYSFQVLGVVSISTLKKTLTTPDVTICPLPLCCHNMTSSPGVCIKPHARKHKFCASNLRHCWFCCDAVEGNEIFPVCVLKLLGGTANIPMRGPSSCHLIINGEEADDYLKRSFITF